MAFENKLQRDLSGKNDGTVSSYQSSDLRAFRETINGREEILIASYRKMYDIKEKLEEQYETKVLKSAIDELNKEIAEAKKSGQEYDKLQKERSRKRRRLRQEEDEMEKRAFEIAKIYEDTSYKNKSAKEKLFYQEQKKHEYERFIQEKTDYYEAQKLIAETNGQKDEALKIAKEESEVIKKANEEREKAEKEFEKIKKRTSDYSDLLHDYGEIAKQSKKRINDAEALYEIELEAAQTQEERDDATSKFIKERNEATKDYKDSLEGIKKLEEARYNISVKNAKLLGKSKSDLRKEKAEISKRRADAAGQNLSDVQDNYARDYANANTDAERAEVDAKYQPQLEQAQSEYNKASSQASIDEAMTNFYSQFDKLGNKLISRLNDAADEKLNSAISTVTNLKSPLSTRLQGASTNYDDIMDTLSGNLFMSPYVSYQKVVENIQKLVESGIAYNVEERAFLAEISDKVATTFDAFDSNLLRLIRLQQADTTAARLGMESALTSFFNGLFSDTSYLSDLRSTVSGAILDASSVLSYEDSTEFEYILQKWMGSLYSLGFSSSAVEEISQGINMLATGDVTGLSSNTAMQTLFGIASSRGENTDYADMLLNGPTASQLNELLKNVVTYLKEIATTSSSNVVKSAYGDIFNMSLSDFQAVQNLSDAEIETIYSSTMSYENAMDYLNSELQSITSRMSISEMLSNVVDNALYAQGESIATNPALYIMWELTDLIQKSTGGIHLPAIEVFGNMLDLSAFTVEGILKSDIVGLSTLALIPEILSSLNSGGGISGNIFSNWGASQTLTRGNGVNLTPNGVSSGTSGGTYVGSGSSDDMYTSSILQETENAEDVSNITNPDADEEKTFQDLWDALFEEQKEIKVHSDSFDEFVGRLLDDKETVATTTSSAYDIEDLYNKLFVDRDYVTTVAYQAEMASGKYLRAKTTATASETRSKILENFNLLSGSPTSSSVYVQNALSTKIVDIDQNLKDSIKQYIESVLIKLMNGELEFDNSIINAESEETGESLKDYIRKIVTGETNINVEVKNTGFQDAISKYSYFSS